MCLSKLWRCFWSKLLFFFPSNTKSLLALTICTLVNEYGVSGAHSIHTCGTFLCLSNISQGKLFFDVQVIWAVCWSCIFPGLVRGSTLSHIVCGTGTVLIKKFGPRKKNLMFKNGDSLSRVNWVYLASMFSIMTATFWLQYGQIKTTWFRSNQWRKSIGVLSSVEWLFQLRTSNHHSRVCLLYNHSILNCWTHKSH